MIRLSIDQPEGNYYNKYGSKNVIVKKIMANYFRSIDKVLNSLDFIKVYEACCGEGHIVNYLNKSRTDLEIYASDISEDIISAAMKRWPSIKFHVSSIYKIEFSENCFDLVVACEVLEHLERTREALQELLRISRRYLLVSVPKEPLWRMLNIMRGQYITMLGNTPGHIRHWSQRQIAELVSEQCNIIKIHTPMPRTMILCEKRDNFYGKNNSKPIYI